MVWEGDHLSTKVCCWKKSCSTPSPAKRKTNAAFFLPENNPPENFYPMQIIRFFVACGGKVKPYQLPKP
jgi:hypothetical protein